MEFAGGSSSSPEELLPGILDMITLGHIVPKLPWTAFEGLLSVSRSWFDAIRTRKVYDARVASESTETFVVFNYAHSRQINALALYSPSDDAYYRLPPIPLRTSGSLSWDCQFSALDGKIYVMGGRQTRYLDDDSVVDEVHELDIAGWRPWKLCASMEVPKEFFGCGVMDGKVYVFGGASDNDPRTASEVYDPAVDAWSPIAPMQSYRVRHQVVTVGKELYMHGGCVVQNAFFDKWKERLSKHVNLHSDESDEDSGDSAGSDDNPSTQVQMATSWEIYHPANDMWRVMQPPFDGLPSVCFGILFMAQGKFYALSEAGVHVLECDKWTKQCSLSFDAAGQNDLVTIEPDAALLVGDEILAMVTCYWRVTDSEIFDSESCLLRTSGFGGKDGEIVWQKLACTVDLGQESHSMCLVQL